MGDCRLSNGAPAGGLARFIGRSRGRLDADAATLMVHGRLSVDPVVPHLVVGTSDKQVDSACAAGLRKRTVGARRCGSVRLVPAARIAGSGPDRGRSMLFNSGAFAVFLPVMLLAYWRLHGARAARALLIGSLFFYSWWDWRLTSLLLLTVAVDYACGLAIAATENVRRRRWILTVSVVSNLGVLAGFKYFNFSATRLRRCFRPWGWRTICPCCTSYCRWVFRSIPSSRCRTRSTCIAGCRRSEASAASPCS